MDVLPYAPEPLSKLFHKWCMRRLMPGLLISNDLFILRVEEYAVVLDVKPVSGNIPHSIASYVYASNDDPVGPELSLWFDDYTTKRVSDAVWESILHRFCPDSRLWLAEEPSFWKEVVYPDGRVNEGELFDGGTIQRILIYPARERVRWVPPLTFADMEGVL